MSELKDKIVDKLKAFGIEENEANIYTYLLLHPKQSILEISRELQLGRNIVYRLVQKLHGKNLVKYVQSSSGQKVKALPYKNLEKILNKKEEETHILKNMMPELFGNFAELVSQGDDVNIHYYQGLEGLKEITLNSLNAQDELLIFEVSDMSAFLDYGFAEEVRREFAKRKVKVRELTNLQEMPAWTNIIEHIKHWSCKYIDPEDLSINFEFIVYNNTYSMYTFKDNQIWGLEIISEPIAAMQKQLFDFMWKKAQKVKLLNPYGKCVVVQS